MAKRTMTISRLWYHPARKRDDPGPVSDLPDGTDLLTLFKQFVEKVDPDKLVRQDTLSYVSVAAPPTLRGRALLLTTESGRFGEKGNVKDVITHQAKGKFGENDATAVITHGVLLVPKVGTSALAFVERSAGQGGMARLLDVFIPWFGARFPKHILERDSIVEKDAWIEHANLVKVRATARSQLTDLASGAKDTVVGNVVHTIEPVGANDTLPRWLWKRLRDNKLDRAKYLGLSEHTDPDTLDVDVTLAGGGQTKTFEIDTEKTPAMRMVLTTSGESAFDAGKVLKAALDEASDIFAEYGIEWSEADATNRRSDG